VNGVSAIGGWAAAAAIPLTAVLGAVLRRQTGTRSRVRMRGHRLIGYAALGAVVVHLATAGRAMGFADASGVWIGTAALGALAAQAFVGASLLDPGGYRRPLRRWHVTLFWIIFALSAAHIALDAPYLRG
jgi:hypothetical protein